MIFHSYVSLPEGNWRGHVEPSTPFSHLFFSSREPTKIIPKIAQPNHRWSLKASPSLTILRFCGHGGPGKAHLNNWRLIAGQIINGQWPWLRKRFIGGTYYTYFWPIFLGLFFWGISPRNMALYGTSILGSWNSHWCEVVSSQQRQVRSQFANLWGGSGTEGARHLEKSNLEAKSGHSSTVRNFFRVLGLVTNKLSNGTTTFVSYIGAFLPHRSVYMQLDPFICVIWVSENWWISLHQIWKTDDWLWWQCYHLAI